MATISFANLDQDFSMLDPTQFPIYQTTDSETSDQYSFLTGSGHDLDFSGNGFTYSGGIPIGGTVNSIGFDFDNDGAAPEIFITDLNFDVTALQIGSGTAEEQNDRFWQTVLGGEDTFDLTMANYGAGLVFAGDGANVTAGIANGQADRFIGGPQGLIGGAAIAGDYLARTIHGGLADVVQAIEMT